MLAKSVAKKRKRQHENLKPNKKKKQIKNKVFYGFECEHCPEDKDGDSQVRWTGCSDETNTKLSSASLDVPLNSC